MRIKNHTTLTRLHHNFHLQIFSHSVCVTVTTGILCCLHQVCFQLLAIQGQNTRLGTEARHIESAALDKPIHEPIVEAWMVIQRTKLTHQVSDCTRSLSCIRFPVGYVGRRFINHFHKCHLWKTQNPLYGLINIPRKRRNIGIAK
jgi:hypothetical protein